MFLELMKQPYTPSRRIGTAQLIDELSLGTSMVSSRIVMGTEIRAFLLRAKGHTQLYPMQELIWTKVAYVLGDTYPSLAQLSPAEELSVQKSFFDHLWGYSLSDMVEIIGDAFPLSNPFVELSREINEKNDQFKDELRSFTQTYDTELRGAIEIAGETAADVIHQLAEQEAGTGLSPTPQERASVVNMCRNLLYHAFRKRETRDALRLLHIGTSIHANMRWDKERKFKPNDFYDFEHAMAALSYCDAFLTEGPLHDLVTRPSVNLEAVNGCRVFSDVEAAANHVGQLSAIS